LQQQLGLQKKSGYDVYQEALTASTTRRIASVPIELLESSIIYLASQCPSRVVGGSLPRSVAEQAATAETSGASWYPVG
jgi:hypothetical protein